MYRWKILRFVTRKDSESIHDQRMDALKYVKRLSKPNIITKEEYLDMLEYNEEQLSEIIGVRI